MSGEEQVRLHDILSGPWREKSLLARETLPALSPEELRRYLRSHFLDPIREPREIAFRESFDYLLEELQLLELAVATGFLPLDSVRAHAEAEYSQFVASAPARSYLRTYDLLPVRYLAARLGIDLGIGAVRPPAVNPQLSVRYVVFLSTHYEFVASPSIRRFLMLIDDFVFGGRFNAAFFQQHLAVGPDGLTAGEQELFRAAAAGLLSFVEDLGDFFLSVPAGEQGYFGLAYSYWLSHFFGLRRVQTGYERKAVSFEDVQVEPATEKERFRARIATLSEVWHQTREVIRAAEPRP